MAKTRQQKIDEAAALSDKLQRMKVAVFSTTAGLKVKDVNALRSILRKEGIDHVVSKKTVLQRALTAAQLERIDISPIAQSFAVTFGYDDEVTPAKLLAQFAKTHEPLKFVGGILDGALVDAASVTALSKLPTRMELRGQLVGTIAAPISGFLNVLIGNVRGLVRALDQIRASRPA